MMKWEHMTTLTEPKNIEASIRSMEPGGWQVCGAIVKVSGLALLILKRPRPAPRPAPRTPSENDQAFLDLIEHHRQHHLYDESARNAAHLTMEP